MKTKQAQIKFKLLDETYLSVAGSDIYEMEIDDIHPQRSIYYQEDLNIDNYANRFRIIIQPTANIKHASGKMLFDIFMNQSSIEEIYLEIEREGHTTIEPYTFYQEWDIHNSIYFSDYQKQFIDEYGCLCIDINAE